MADTKGRFAPALQFVWWLAFSRLCGEQRGRMVEYAREDRKSMRNEE
jgi:hypothetical protein